MVANRREQLEEFVRKNPGEAFARYGLAMEMIRSGESEAALEQFRVLQEQHPDYPAGFQQAGQLLLGLGRKAEAKAVLERGIAAAGRRGDGHAAAEMRGLLEEASC
ncbi:MAG TPA: hypothetical protein VMV31_11005 [Terriglobales bacterium]|nr:hypothetical protein [Terriglobales bacterium]